MMRDLTQQVARYFPANLQEPTDMFTSSPEEQREVERAALLEEYATKYREEMDALQSDLDASYGIDDPQELIERLTTIVSESNARIQALYAKYRKEESHG